MTLQEAKSIVRHLGLTLRKVRSGDYCVRSREGNEPTPYYTDDLEDAVNTAVRMVRKATRMRNDGNSHAILWLSPTDVWRAGTNPGTGAKRLVRSGDVSAEAISRSSARTKRPSISGR
jgi:hypothetical protein